MGVLNQKQLALLAEFAKDLSLFFFGTALAPLFAKVDTIDYSVILLGVVDGILLLWISMRLLRRKNNGTNIKS